MQLIFPNNFSECTKTMYRTQKKRLAEEEGMLSDIAGDWLPTATIQAIASGLYCMEL